MKTGMMAAEGIHSQLDKSELDFNLKIDEYQDLYQNSWVREELHRSRNFKDGFKKGLYWGMVKGEFNSLITKGREKDSNIKIEKDSDVFNGKSQYISIFTNIFIK